MWFSGIPFVIGAWLTISTIVPQPFAQWSDTTSVILLEYSEPMSMDSLLHTGNYMVLTVDDGKVWRIHKVALVKELKDSAGNLVVADTSLIALVTEKLPYRKHFEIRAANVKDKAGNLVDPEHKTVWFFFNGFAPNKFETPVVGIGK
jgi:hypothetical protein